MMDGEIILLPLERRHLEFLRGLRNDLRMSQYVFSPSIPLTVLQQELWFKRYLCDPSSLIFIAHVQTLCWVGYGQLKHIDRLHRSAELGSHIDPEWQDEGWGTKLVLSLLEVALMKLGMHRVWLEVFADNARAIHVYEKCGFMREGIQRDKILKDGRFEDVVVMSIINEICP